MQATNSPTATEEVPKGESPTKKEVPRQTTDLMDPKSW